MRNVIAMLSLIACATAWADAMPADRSHPPIIDCPAAEYDQVNFLLGEWALHSRERYHLPTKVKFTPLLNGCAIFERRTESSGREVIALIVFDLAEKKWRRHYVDHVGEVRNYAGQWKNGKMHFRADDVGSHDLEPGIWTLTFEPLAGGKVRESSSTSDDGGKTFDPHNDRTLERLIP